VVFPAARGPTSMTAGKAANDGSAAVVSTHLLH